MQKANRMRLAFFVGGCRGSFQRLGMLVGVAGGRPGRWSDGVLSIDTAIRTNPRRYDEIG